MRSLTCAEHCRFGQRIAFGTSCWEFEGWQLSFSLMFLDADDMRNNPTSLFDDDHITDTHILPAYFIGVVQAGPADGGTG